MNPFNEKPCKIEKCVADWRKIYPTAYDKNDADAYTKVRAILLNGAECERIYRITADVTYGVRQERENIVRKMDKY